MKVKIRENDSDLVNDNPPITFPYQLDTFQKNAINAIEEGEHVLVTAHTSAGKSTVAEYAIAKAMNEGKKVVYTSPIKTLSNQKYYDFKQRYDSVGILTGDIKENPNADCIVMTTEILRNMLFRGSDFIDELSYVIFDEIHYINDRDRGHVWEETIVMLPEKIGIIMLSATINNSFEFAQWIASIKNKNVSLVGTKYRPVPLRHYIYFDKEIHQIVDTKNNFDAKKYNSIYQNYKNAARRRFNFTSKLNPLVSFLNEKNLFPCIFFSFSRKKCEQFASMIESSLLTTEESSMVVKIFNKYIKGMFQAYGKLSQTNKLFGLLKKGLGFHHSGLVPPLKEIQEILFAKGLIKILFATETFAVGVNMPTRTVVFTELSKFDGYCKSKRILNTSEYLQMAGRSGRRGKDKNGTVIYFPTYRPIDLIDMGGIINGKSANINSKLKLNTQLLMKIMQTNQFQLDKFVNKSLLGGEDKIIIDKMNISYNKKNQIMKELEEKVKLFKHNDELIEYFKMKESLQYCRPSKQKKNERKLKLIEQNVDIKKEIDIQIKYNEIQNELFKLNKSLKSNSLHFELNVAKSYLQELEFINPSEKSLIELDRTDLTLKGLMGAEINECNEILLTEILNNNLLNELNTEEICGVLGLFVQDRTEFHYSPNDLPITEGMKECLYNIGDLNHDLEELAYKYNLAYDGSIRLNFVVPIYMWASGETIRDIYHKNNLDMYEGNFVKNVIKVLNICNEIVYVCELIGKTDLVEKFQNIESKLLRDVVSFDSIYINSE